MNELEVFLYNYHTAMKERLSYNINLFNAAVNNVIILRMDRVLKMTGGIEQSSFFGIRKGLIRRRNPAGLEPLDLKRPLEKMTNQIRIAWTTELLDMSRNELDWMNRDPALAGVQLGIDMANQKLEEYILRIFSILRATVGSNEKTVRDRTAKSDDSKYITHANLVRTAGLFGDAQGELRTWIMPTAAKSDLIVSNLNNSTQLFKIGTVVVTSDVEGRTFITSDDPNLIDEDAQGNLKYWVYGLRTGGVGIEELNDFDELYDAKGGLENILRTYQANWSTKLGIMGYKYDESQLIDTDDNLGKFASASDAALAATENWTQVQQSHKTTAGVALIVNARDD